MNNKSKKKFMKAVGKVGLNKLCRLRNPDRKETHSYKGQSYNIVSYDSLLPGQLGTVRKILPVKGLHRTTIWRKYGKKK